MVLPHLSTAAGQLFGVVSGQLVGAPMWCLATIRAGMKIPLFVASHCCGSSADRHCGGGDLPRNVLLDAPLAALAKGVRTNKRDGILNIGSTAFLSCPSFLLFSPLGVCFAT